MRTRVAGLVVALLACGLAALTAQQAGSTERAAGIILGRVVAAGTNDPVAGAIVRLRQNGQEQEPAAVVTAADGQFVFTGVPAGTFSLSASRSGYLNGDLDQREPIEPGLGTLTMRANDRVGDITLRVWKYGAIAGTVVDESGEPIVGLSIGAFRRTFVAGHPLLTLPGGFVSTDDRGMFRVRRLIPGDYVVGVELRTTTLATAMVEKTRGPSAAARAETMALASALVFVIPPGEADSRRLDAFAISTNQPPIAARTGELFVYPAQFNLASMSPSTARVITVHAGDEAGGVDFALKPTRTFRVSGRLTDERGPVARMAVSLLANATDFTFESFATVASSMTDSDGRFTMLGVPAGDYQLSALEGAGGEIAIGFESAGAVIGSTEGTTLVRGGEFTSLAAPARPATRFAQLPVVVADHDVGNLAVNVRNGVSLSGEIAFGGSKAAPPPEKVRNLGIFVERQDGRSVGVQFEATGRTTDGRHFDTVGLPPGRYFVRVRRPPAGWALESVMYGGRDVSTEALEVADKPLEGLVIRFTDTPTMVTGTVRAFYRGDQLDSVMVAAFPVDRSAWQDFGAQPRTLQSAPVRTDGSFALPGLPAGEYFVVALPNSYLNDWRQPAFLEAASRDATRVTITTAGQQNVALTYRSPR